MLSSIRSIFGVDHDVFKILTLRVWTIFAGVITIIFVTGYLNIEEQGYYYTFLSIVVLQVLFDLGFSQTVTQITSHEFAHVDWSTIRSTGNCARVMKLAYIKATVLRWYQRLAIVFVLLVAMMGSIYFSLFGMLGSDTWLGPWIALVLTTGINLNLSPRFAMAEGAGLVGAVAQLRLAQSVCGYALFIMFLIAGAGLWSIVIVPATANLMSFAWLRWGKNPFRSVPDYVANIHDHLPWRTEILGLQWRVAVAWLGGYFASQVIVPLVFALRGAGEAGRVGLGLQIFTAVQALGTSWITARVPRFGQLISLGDIFRLKAEFKRAAFSAISATGLGSLIVVLALEGVRHTSLPFVDRLPSAITVCALALVATLTTAIYGLAAYMRAYKEEPLVLSSLAIGAATVVGAAAGGQFGTDEVVVAYAFVTACINLPWTVMIFLSYYARVSKSGVDGD